MQSKMGGGCSLLLGNGNRSRDKNACACTWHSAAHVVKECERENSPMGCNNFVRGEVGGFDWRGRHTQKS